MVDACTGRLAGREQAPECRAAVIHSALDDA